MNLSALRQYLRARMRRHRRRINQLELHVTHACNLTCESCSHYSNHGHRGHLQLSEADKWMSLWSGRFDVNEFDLLGGEPTIHPELSDFVLLVRRHWPDALIKIFTNGFFLHRHPTLPRVLAANGRANIVLSVHHGSTEYLRHLLPIFGLVRRWQREFGVNAKIFQSFADWTRRYQGFGDTMQPFEDGSPRASWEICPARHCKQLFEGKIWKCAPLAYLKLQKARYQLSSKWDPYLNYEPLDPGCSDHELDQFLALEDEVFCGMCSAKPRRFDLPMPTRAKKLRFSPSVLINDEIHL